MWSHFLVSRGRRLPRHMNCSVFAYYYFDAGNVQVAHGRAPGPQPPGSSRSARLRWARGPLRQQKHHESPPRHSQSTRNSARRHRLFLCRNPVAVSHHLGNGPGPGACSQVVAEQMIPVFPLQVFRDRKPESVTETTLPQRPVKEILGLPTEKSALTTEPPSVAVNFSDGR